MLDERPLLKRAAYGSGAFAFVFTAAMAGTAVMISGGVFPVMDGPSQSAPLQRAAWLDPSYIEDAPPLRDAPWTRENEARPVQYAANQTAYQYEPVTSESDFDSGLLEAYSEPQTISDTPELEEGDTLSELAAQLRAQREAAQNELNGEEPTVVEPADDIMVF